MMKMIKVIYLGNDGKKHKGFISLRNAGKDIEINLVHEDRLSWNLLAKIEADFK